MGTLTPNEAYQAIAAEVEDWQATAPGTKITEKVNKERRDRLNALDSQCAWEEGTAIKAFQAMVKAKRKARSHVRSHAKESDARMAQPSTPLDHCAQAVALAAGLHESNELVGAVAEACSLNQFSVKDWAARWRRSDSHGDRARKHGLDVNVATSTVMAAAGSASAGTSALDSTAAAAASGTLAAPSLAALRKLERDEQIAELRKLHSWLKTGGALSALASVSSILQGRAPHAAALLAAVRGASTRAPPAPLAPRTTKSRSSTQLEDCTTRRQTRRTSPTQCYGARSRRRRPWHGRRMALLPRRGLPSSASSWRRRATTSSRAACSTSQAAFSQP
jgi:hypothetical protein